MKIINGSNIVIGRFGLMHMVATNFSLWVNLVVQETIHEHHSGHPHQPPVEGIPHAVNTTLAVVLFPSSTDKRMNAEHQNHVWDFAPAASNNACHHAELMGSLTQSLGPFLFPCAIEYSLICAAIFYEIWKHTGHRGHGGHRVGTSTGTSGFPSGSRTPRTPNSLAVTRRSPHHYSVDCTNANNGLFLGIFIFVLTIISMILFLVFINRDGYRDMAVTEVHIVELILYLMTLGAVIIGMIRVCMINLHNMR